MKPLALPDLLPLRAALQPKADADKAAAPDAWQREMEKAQASMWLGHDPVGAGARGALDTPSHADSRRGAPMAERLSGPQRGRAALDPGEANCARHDQKDATAARGAPRIQFATSLFAASPAPAPATAGALVVSQARQPVLAAVGAVIARATTASVDVFAGTEPPRAAASPLGLAGVRLLPPDDAQEPASTAHTGKAFAAAPADDADPEAVRVYCQFSPEGLMVWIGAAAHSGFNAQAVAAQLHQALARQSQRLAAFICNGGAVTLPAVPLIHPHDKEPTWPLEQ